MNQRMKKIKVVTMLMTLFVVISLTACKETVDFDAKRYVQGCLDSSTKEKYDDFVAMTNMKKEDAQMVYDERILKAVEIVGANKFGEELEAQYIEMYKSIFANHKYEVGEAVKNEDGSYTVSVTTYSLKVFEGTMENAKAELSAWIDKKQGNGKQPTNDEVTKKRLEITYDIIMKKMEKPEYGEAVKIDVAVVPKESESGIAYAIDANSFEEVLASCLDAN